MPIVHVSLIEGFDEFEKLDLMDRLTDAVRLGIGVPRDGVTIIIDEISAGNYREGGEPPSEIKPELPQAVVHDFVNAMKHGNFGLARGFTMPGFTARFPDGTSSNGIEDAADWAARHFKKLVKNFESFEEAALKDGRVAVYTYGALEGEWADGTPFGGVPFIDRFTVIDGKLVDQQTWCNLIVATPTSA